MQRTKIEWADYVLNPIVGCPHGCSYCYAKQLNKRFKFVPVWEEPQFFPERLNSQKPIKLPKNRNRIAQLISPDKPVVFVGSMSDVFSGKVEDNWISQIIDFAYSHPEAVFMFLTKKPLRYSNFVFPANCIIGTSVERGNTTRIWELFAHSADRKFVSAEPLTGTFRINAFANPYSFPKQHELEFVIVGAMTGTNAVKPQLEWVESVKHPRVYFKDNILKHFPNLSK